MLACIQRRYCDLSVKVWRRAYNNGVDISAFDCRSPVGTPATMKLADEILRRDAFGADYLDKLVIRRLDDHRCTPAHLQTSPDKGNSHFHVPQCQCDG